MAQHRRKQTVEVAEVDVFEKINDVVVIASYEVIHSRTSRRLILCREIVDNAIDGAGQRIVPCWRCVGCFSLSRIHFLSRCADIAYDGVQNTANSC